MSADDPRLPGLRAAGEFLHGYCGRHGATDIGRELFHIHAELDYWIDEIESGDEGMKSPCAQPATAGDPDVGKQPVRYERGLCFNLHLDRKWAAPGSELCQDCLDAHYAMIAARHSQRSETCAQPATAGDS